MSEKTIAQELADALATVASLTADAKAANELVEQAQAQIAEKDAKIGELTGQLEAANQLIETGNASLADLTNKLTAAESAKVEAENAAAKLREAVAKNPAFAHAAAGREPVKDVATDAAQKTLTLSEFNARTPAERMAFSLSGGKIVG